MGGGRQRTVFRRRHQTAFVEAGSSEDSTEKFQGQTHPDGGLWVSPHGDPERPDLPLPRCPEPQLLAKVGRGGVGSRAAAASGLGPLHLVASDRALRSGTCRPAPEVPTSARARSQRAPEGLTPPGSPPAHAQEAAAALPAAGRGLPAPLAPAAPARHPARAAPPHLRAHVRHEGGLGRLGAAATADYPFPQHTAALGSSDAREQRGPLGLRQRRRPPALAAGAPPIPRAAAAPATPASGSAADTARPAHSAREPRESRARGRRPRPLRSRRAGLSGADSLSEIGSTPAEPTLCVL